MFKYKSSGDVVLSAKGTATTTYTKSEGASDWISLSFANDGNTTITLSIGTMDMDILSGETFDEDFEPFDEITVTIATTGSYRLMLRS
jgi:hypothetical protein